MNYIKWKIEEIKKYVSSTLKIEPTIPIKLSVEKMTATTYAGETAYENEQFILLNIYPKTNGTVKVTYGGLTKTITDTSGAESPNARRIFFGTFNGISDSVVTPSSGELIIEGDYGEYAFTTGTYQSTSKTLSVGYYSGIKDVLEYGNISVIPSNAFYHCTSLTSITIPSSVTSIGENAFNGCSSLENVYYKGTIEDWCNIKFYDNLESIPMYYAEHCYMLDKNNEYYEVTEIEIPDTITSIRNYQFYGFDNVIKVTIPSSVTSIGEGAFKGCTNVESMTIPFVGNTLNGTENTHFGYIFGQPTYDDAFPQLNLKKVIITGGTSISKGAFYYYTSITSIELPNSVTSIGENAFYHCESLTSITIPNSVTSIDGAFNGCSSLKSIVIPNSVTSIGNYTFYYCESLTSITIPNSVTSIGNYTFESCKSLTSITIPNSVTHIGNFTFFGCKSLTSITIPNSVTSIGYNTFRACTSLTNVTFANTSGWYVTETRNATSGTVVDVSNSANNVTLLTNTYSEYYYWYRS